MSPFKLSIYSLVKYQGSIDNVKLKIKGLLKIEKQHILIEINKKSYPGIIHAGAQIMF